MPQENSTGAYQSTWIMPSTSSTNVMTSESLKKEERNHEIEEVKKILATLLECS
jgi:hypothetical protein